MVYCKAWGCKNRGGPDVQRHTFPKDPTLLRKWIVRVNREDFTEKHVTKNSMLCSDHFLDSDYERSPKLLKSMGMKFKSVLKKDAVPSVFAHRPLKERQSQAIEKRRKLKILEESLMEESDDPDIPCEDPTETETPGIAIQTELPPEMFHKSVLANMKPSTKQKGSQYELKSRDNDTQTYIQLKDAGIQCDLLLPPIESSVEDEPMETDDRNDPNWLPGEEVGSADDLDENDDEQDIDDTLHGNPPALEERKFLVYESCLHALLAVCTVCMLPCQVILQRCKGSMVTLLAVCSNGHQKTWTSQPMMGSMPRGNVDISAAILFSGSTAAKAVNMMKHLNLFTITTRTFIRIQKFYLIPAVFKHWKEEQDDMLRLMRRSPKARLGSDGRFDSTGHLAKYMSYCMLDMATGLIVMIHLVQRNECSSCNAMELEGFKRSIGELQRRRVPIESIVTDRHVGVRKYLRTEKPNIKHWFDIWHVAKSVYKKILKAATRRASQDLQKWARSITNHLFWSATSSDGELAKAKWLSIMNHIIDKHNGHGDLYPVCAHEDLSEEPREWIKPGSKAYKELELVVTNARLVKDVGHLSPYDQTASIESYHKIVCFFAPKTLHFFHSAMKARVLLAALHFNENTQRQQKVTDGGKPQFVVSYQKFDSNRGVVKEVKVPCTYDYVKKLMAVVYQLRVKFPTYKQAETLVTRYEYNMPDTLTSGLEKTGKEKLIADHVSRFCKRYDS